MTDWQRLEHAYGAAGDVPGLLAKAATGGPDAGDAWDDLWACLCHQGTVYSASYAALPLLAELAVQAAPSAYVQPLHLAASIIGSEDVPDLDEVPRLRSLYVAELAALEGQAMVCLSLPQLRADPTSFIYLLEAILALRGTRGWSDLLVGLADEEITFPCPSCEVELYLRWDNDRAFVTSDWGIEIPAGAVPVVAADPRSLDGTAAWLQRTALEHRQLKVALRLTHVCGRSSCPACSTPLRPSG